MGDPAPPLRVTTWVKGEPVERFEKGKVYVVEFWATWCGPCIAAMPHLSALAREYKDSVTVLSIDIDEKKKTPLQKIKAFVDSMGDRMDYRVAIEDSDAMTTGWLDASGETGIPTSFVVNTDGRLAWIGHPAHLRKVLPKILNNSWDIKEGLAKQHSDKRLEALDRKVYNEVSDFLGDPRNPNDFGKPDSVLLVINELVRKEPKLKYAPSVAFNTFSALLKTNLQKAYEYGKEVLVTTTYEGPACYAIIDAIHAYSSKLNLPEEIYELGAEAYQGRIDQIVYPEITDVPTLYMMMAQWYSRANNKSKAIEAQQKAIEALKSQHTRKMAAFESRLEGYKKM
jgi:thiol-disulfide isomerase/thioredoxin